MQIAAQIERAPATSRVCGGHHGTHFVPVASGNGRWVYYWLTLPQLWFWRILSAREKAILAQNENHGCFVCQLQIALERRAMFGEELN
jgi:hypothetical protein